MVRLGLSVCFAVITCVAARSAAAEEVRFHDDVRPILAVHCFGCHGPDEAKSDLRLDLRDRALAGGKSGKAALVPGDAAGSELHRRITSDDPDEVMPPKGPRLSPAEMARLRTWIEQGAPWPERDDYWAFKPPTSPAVPASGDGAPSTNPIDDFISSRLREVGIVPTPPADARTLLRRAYADLLGVPPSPQEADAFLHDTSTDGFEKLIARLLDDPRYGERWARHWLDLVRYSESDGFEDDKIRPHAWRYRDYVIRAFNSDKPYDRFVKEQVAGDELWPGEADALIATGFARLGAWDGMSKEPQRQRQDFLNDATDAVGSVFLGMTVGCARCHDHKYDPITQRDYYGFQAFFAGVKRVTADLPGAPGDPPHVVEALARARAALAEARGERDALLRDARAEVEWANRCDVDEQGRVKVTDEQVRKKAERLRPGRLAQLDAKVKEQEAAERLNRPAVEAVVEENSSPPKTVLLKGGELSLPREEVAPAFIEAMAPAGSSKPVVVPHPGSRGSGRRAVLASWLASRDNPLTARVWVNRLWRHHFGRGLVATPSDFGRHGQRPSHPELLDWLACRLVADGWSTKNMHRLMMTSQAYRRASTFSPAAAEKDPQNTLLWRMNRRRLEAEAIRDSVLAVSGRLSETRGGPGVYPRIPKEVNVQLPNNDKELSWYPGTEEEDRRRTVYVFQRRSLTFPLVEVFDGAAMSQTCPVRAETTVAPQALAMLNGEFARESARHMAERVIREAGDGDENRISHAFRLTLARTPTEGEMESAKAFLARQAEVRGAPAEAFVDFCHVLLNTNEFFYLD